MARRKETSAAAKSAQTGAEQSLRADTVIVALNRASGIAFGMPDGRRVHVAGSAAHLRGKEKGILPVGAFGLTEISADDWSYVEKTYGPHMEIFRNGLIFAQARKADALDAANERAELRHGLEPVDVESDGNGAKTTPFDGTGA